MNVQAQNLDLLRAIKAEKLKRIAQVEFDREVELNGASLLAFVAAGWHVLEPGTPYVHGLPVEAMSEHLEAVTNGEIIRLLMNVPPGTMKSLLVNVFWPAYEWGPRNLGHHRYLGTSHSGPLAIRDNLKMKRLVSSEWYQSRWPNIKLTSDQNAKTKFENTQFGFREAMAFTSLTGSRGHRVLLDDPHSVDGAKSDTMRTGVVQTFQESLTTRLNDVRTSAIVVVMQRLHQGDISGEILEKDYGYEHLMLPMEFEPERKCYTSIGFQDPRTEDGELLFPERFPREEVERDKKAMGSHASAGQFQQRPAAREGGIFKKSWFTFVRAVPKGTRFCRGWDLAASELKTSAYTAGCKIGVQPNGRYLIADCRRDQLSAGGVEKLLTNTASEDGKECAISLPQDPGQAGKAQVQALIRLLAGYNVRSSPETGDKVSRTDPLSAQAEAGNVDVLVGKWNDEFFDEITVFPASKFKDQTDAASRAFNELVANPPSTPLFGTYGN